MSEIFVLVAGGKAWVEGHKGSERAWIAGY
jgi:hypothetical protein